MKTSKSLLSVFLISLFFISITLNSCKKDDVPNVKKGETKVISGSITQDTTWSAVDTIKISGFVYVKSGATLTIEAGTLIKGSVGTKATLIVERGGKINAVGTVAKPIVFTSDKAAGSRSYGDWGGIVLCGKAKNNKSGGEGTAEGGIGSLYGGTDDSDNSGKLQYVRIEFGGIPLATTTNSEINGLTLYSVGSATTIDHVQVSYSGDDSFEWFGGTVNCKNLVAYRSWDDDFDTDNGYIGTVQFAVSLRDPAQADQSGSNCFESDNDADGSSNTPVTKPIFSNISIFGPISVSGVIYNSQYKRSMHIRRGSQLSVYNSVFSGFPLGLFIDGSQGNSQTMASSNELQIENTVLSGMATFFVSDFEKTYFKTSNRMNDTLATNDLLKVNDAFNLSAPNFTPKTDSPLLNRASFTNTRLSANAFLQQVTFIGAFGSENWTTGWTNFDPQNTQY